MAFRNQITRTFTFDAGHRVHLHESKCRHLHGHTYKAELTVSAPDLDGLGRVLDFSVVKTLVGGWIDKYLDHNMLFHPEDKLLSLAYEYGTSVISMCGREPYVMPEEYPNPTAENIARLIFEKSEALFRNAGHDNIQVDNVRIWETPNCCADYSRTLRTTFQMDMLHHMKAESLPAKLVDDPISFDEFREKIETDPKTVLEERKAETSLGENKEWDNQIGDWVKLTPEGEKLLEELDTGWKPKHHD